MISGKVQAMLQDVQDVQGNRWDAAICQGWQWITAEEIWSHQFWQDVQKKIASYCLYV